MVEFREVSKIYEGSATAVDRLSFHIDEGEVFGLVGTSGCGKTTTLKMINRLIEPTSGQILINGKNIKSRPVEALRRNIGYVIQNVGLFPHYTIEENVSIVPRLLHWDTDRMHARSKELLELTGLNPDVYARRKPASLSGGQQQRVGLARALAGDPQLLLMDEPFGALDPITKEEISREFKALLGRIQKTVVLVTHDVFEAFSLCNRICLMDGGRARQTGTPKELLFKPCDDFVRSFFSSHRLQLEMRSITVADILKSSEEVLESPPKRDLKCIKTTDSFFSVFEMADTDDEQFMISTEDGESGSVSFSVLIGGFQTVRASLKEGYNG